MTTDQRDVLRHALGLRDGMKPYKPYRNHFCTGPGSTDWPTCEALTARGLMRKHDPSSLSGGDYIFVVTAEGCAVLGVERPTK